MFFEEMCKVMEDLREESFAEGFAEGWVEGFAEGFAEGRVEGRAESRTEGREKQAQMTARNLSVQGLSAEQIAQAVGFSVETVEEWLAQRDV